ncbi:MAG: hypothetical protein M3065_10060 [Actinomycetota bacterium]|nr:hypothetical protein [Actinomycetota bacterium]
MSNAIVRTDHVAVVLLAESGAEDQLGSVAALRRHELLRRRIRSCR